MLIWFHNLFEAIVPLFVTIDAPGLLPVFIGLTANLTAVERRRVTFEAVAAGSVIAIGFMFLGGLIFRLLQIDQYDFEIAGGILLLVLAVLDLLTTGKPLVGDAYMIGLVPLATPLIAGPATLTTALVMASTRGYSFTLAALAINFLVLLGAMLAAGPVQRVIGMRTLGAFSKLVMVLLAAIAVNFIRMGVTHVILAARLGG